MFLIEDLKNDAFLGGILTVHAGTRGIYILNIHI